MSHQPSTLDNVRNAASSATHAVADSLDTSSSSESLGSGANSRESTEIKGGYAKDALGNVSEKGSYKDQLNKAAFEGKEGVLAMNKEPDTMMNKVYAFVPGAQAIRDSIYGADKEKETPSKIEDDGTPPTRPANDTQVEEFLKGQYHSKSGQGMPDLGSASSGGSK